MSVHTLEEEFFDNIWPLILDFNRCEIKDVSDCQYFEPKQKFDHLAAHAYLAKKRYAHYKPPIELCCKMNKIRMKASLTAQADSTVSSSDVELGAMINLRLPTVVDSSTEASSITSSSTASQILPKKLVDPLRKCSLVRKKLFQCRLRDKFEDSKGSEKWEPKPYFITEKMLDEKVKDLVEDDEDVEKEKEEILKLEEEIEDPSFDDESVCRIPKAKYIPTLQEQFLAQSNALLERQKLSHDFVQRKEPWYTKKLSWTDTFDLSPKLLKKFKIPSLEHDVLVSLHENCVQNLVIDLASDMGINEVNRWIKFHSIAPLVFTTRNEALARQINLLGPGFYGLFIEPVEENLWQEELEISLNSAFEYMVKNGTISSCAQPVLFVFAEIRGYCACDRFCVIRKH